MFGSIVVSTHSINDYILIIGKEAIDDLHRLAKSLQGKLFLALSSSRGEQRRGRPQP